MGNLLQRAILAHTEHENKKKRDREANQEQALGIARVALWRLLGYSLTQATSLQPVRTLKIDTGVEATFIVERILFRVQTTYNAYNKDPWSTRIDVALWRLHSYTGPTMTNRFQIQNLVDLGARIKQYENQSDQYTFSMSDAQIQMWENLR